jgi:ABC-type phosphate transport system substrate-binding protein
MRLLSKLLAGTASAAALASLVAAPALADPPAGTTPRTTDAVGVGSDTTQYLLDQLALNYDTTHPDATTKLYSWDAVNPDTLAIGDPIVTKAGCAAIPRPDGSSAGIAAFEDNARPSGDSTNYCIDFARSSRARLSTDPPCATGGICFVALAEDAVTWADRDKASGGTDAPASLTTAQLTEIYTCKVTNWKQVGGKSATIEPFLPQTSSGTRAFFLAAIDVTTPGACVSDVNNTLEENEGINPVLDSPEAIFIYSVGDYIAQAYRSAPCTNAGCGEVSPTTPPCAPAGSENKFGCDETGVLTINEINGTNPATPWPLPKPPTPPAVNKGVKINAKFDNAFLRTLYDVVRYDPNTTDHIPGAEAGAPGGINLEKFFGAASAGKFADSSPGYACGAAGQTADGAYGFLASPACGMPS